MVTFVTSTESLVSLISDSVSEGPFSLTECHEQLMRWIASGNPGLTMDSELLFWTNNAQINPIVHPFNYPSHSTQ